MHSGFKINLEEISLLIIQSYLLNLNAES